VLPIDHSVTARQKTSSIPFQSALGTFAPPSDIRVVGLDDSYNLAALLLPLSNIEQYRQTRPVHGAITGWSCEALGWSHFSGFDQRGSMAIRQFHLDGVLWGNVNPSGPVLLREGKRCAEDVILTSRHKLAVRSRGMHESSLLGRMHPAEAGGLNFVIQAMTWSDNNALWRGDNPNTCRLLSCCLDAGG